MKSCQNRWNESRPCPFTYQLNMVSEEDFVSIVEMLKNQYENSAWRIEEVSAGYILLNSSFIVCEAALSFYKELTQKKHDELMEQRYGTNFT